MKNFTIEVYTSLIRSEDSNEEVKAGETQERGKQRRLKRLLPDLCNNPF